MKIYDVSMPIYEGMTVYKNKVEKQPKFDTVTNNYVTETRVSMDVHTGTHVDAPKHMVLAGNTSETISIEKLVGICRLFDLSHVTDGITKEDLFHLEISENDFILFKTQNSNDEAFNPEFIFVKEDAAQYLAEVKIRGVGIDALGIERSQSGHPTHKSLFDADIIVIEGLRLKEVPAGSYFMMAAPIKLMGMDASPARVLLIEGIAEV